MVAIFIKNNPKKEKNWCEIFMKIEWKIISSNFFVKENLIKKVEIIK